MDSFYGGKKGQPFIIKNSYDNFDALINGIDSIEYGEYVLVNGATVDKDQQGVIYQKIPNIDNELKKIGQISALPMIPDAVDMNTAFPTTQAEEVWTPESEVKITFAKSVFNEASPSVSLSYKYKVVEKNGQKQYHLYLAGSLPKTSFHCGDSLIPTKAGDTEDFITQDSGNTFKYTLSPLSIGNLRVESYNSTKHTSDTVTNLPVLDDGTPALANGTPIMLYDYWVKNGGEDAVSQLISKTAYCYSPLFNQGILIGTTLTGTYTDINAVLTELNETNPSKYSLYADKGQVITVKISNAAQFFGYDHAKTEWYHIGGLVNNVSSHIAFGTTDLSTGETDSSATELSPGGIYFECNGGNIEAIYQKNSNNNFQKYFLLDNHRPMEYHLENLYSTEKLIDILYSLKKGDRCYFPIMAGIFEQGALRGSEGELLPYHNWVGESWITPQKFFIFDDFSCLNGDPVNKNGTYYFHIIVPAPFIFPNRETYKGIYGISEDYNKKIKSNLLNTEIKNRVNSTSNFDYQASLEISHVADFSSFSNYYIPEAISYEFLKGNVLTDISVKISLATDVELFNCDSSLIRAPGGGHLSQTSSGKITDLCNLTHIALSDAGQLYLARFATGDYASVMPNFSGVDTLLGITKGEETQVPFAPKYYIDNAFLIFKLAITI